MRRGRCEESQESVMHILQITSPRVPPSKAWVWTPCSYQRVLGLAVGCRDFLSPVSAHVTGPLLPEPFISRDQQLIMSTDWSSGLICSLVVGVSHCISQALNAIDTSLALNKAVQGTPR